MPSIEKKNVMRTQQVYRRASTSQEPRGKVFQNVLQRTKSAVFQNVLQRTQSAVFQNVLQKTQSAVFQNVLQRTQRKSSKNVFSYPAVCRARTCFHTQRCVRQERVFIPSGVSSKNVFSYPAVCLVRTRAENQCEVTVTCCPWGYNEGTPAIYEALCRTQRDEWSLIRGLENVSS